MPVSRARALLLLVGWISVGCTLVLTPEEDQCETNQDCVDRGLPGGICEAGVCAEDPVWGCLDNLQEPTPNPTRKVEVTLKFIFAIDDTPIPMDADIDVCDTLDLDCTGTNPDHPKNLHPDSQGFATASVPEGFNGFLRVTHPDIVESRVFVGRPILEQPKYNLIRVLHPSDIDLLANFAGLTIDPARGFAIMVALDCSEVRASGVRFESSNADANSAEFYLINDFPIRPPDAVMTDVDGFGGYANLPAGSAVATAIRAKDETFIGQTSYQLFANTISYVLIGPTKP